MYQTRMTSTFAVILSVALFGIAWAQTARAEQKGEQHLLKGSQTVLG